MFLKDTHESLRDHFRHVRFFSAQILIIDVLGTVEEVDGLGKLK
jgi:hypothetical protein